MELNSWKIQMKGTICEKAAPPEPPMPLPPPLAPPRRLLGSGKGAASFKQQSKKKLKVPKVSVCVNLR